MAENLCVKMGGGGGKGTLLWTNPNPNSAITSNIDVPIDWSAYSHIYAEMKYASDSTYDEEYHELKHNLTFSGKTTTMNFARPEPNSSGDISVAYRYYQVNSSGIRITGTAGYANVNNSARYANSVFCIPVAIYGK